MKKMFFKGLALSLVVVMLCLALASCGKILSGSYEGEIDIGIAKYTATYTFKGNKVEVEKKTTTILGAVDTVELNGTYEIQENDDGTMEITLTFESEDDDVKSGTFTFEEGEDYIKIGLAKYTKKA